MSPKKHPHAAPEGEETEQEAAEPRQSAGVIGITTGDLNGVGLEIIIKTLSDPRVAEICTPVLFASEKAALYYKNVAPQDTPFKFTVTKDLNNLQPGNVYVFSCWDEEVPIQPGVLTDTAGKYAVRSLQVATQCLKDGQIHGMVTAPIHKGNTRLPDFPYTGHTPFLQEAFGAKDVVMLLHSEELRVALATEHIPVGAIPGHLTKERLTSKLTILRDCLVKDFGIDKPKIAVLGLNPHAGDEGTIGTEEQTIIRPVIEHFQSHGHLIQGPYAADAFFARQSYRQFDAVLALYHDQGLIPFKTIALGDGVNYTAGLPVVRTSPDHGTAFDIAGHGVADPSSFREALFQCIDRIRYRASYAEATANPLPRGRSTKERSVGSGN